jgi:hypothetical protein
MVIFLDAYDLSKLNQEVINNLNIYNKLWGSSSNKVSQQKRPQNCMNSLLNSSRPLKWSNTSAPETTPKMEGQEARITLIPKPKMDTTKKKAIDQFPWCT